jgi:hypothetical protein
MRFAIGTLVLTTVLAGCADSQMVGSLFYLTPYKFEDLTCAELKNRGDAATARAKDFESLRQKAAIAPGGSGVGTMVYAPDQERAKWDRQLYVDEYARRNCAAASATPPSSPPALPPETPQPTPATPLPPPQPLMIPR